MRDGLVAFGGRLKRSTGGQPAGIPNQVVGGVIAAHGVQYVKYVDVDPDQFPLFSGIGDTLVRRTHTQALSPAL